MRGDGPVEPGLLLFNGVAMMQPSVINDGGCEKMVVWVRITPAGWMAIAA
jgi:hypothetical protein